MSSRRGFAGMAVVVAAAIAGCTAPNHEDSAPDTLTVDLNYLLGELDQHDVSLSQQEAVMNAFDSGEMVYDVVDALFREYVACLEDAGFSVDGVGRQEIYTGVYAPTARIQFPDSLDEEAASRVDINCARKHYTFAEQFYVGQPTSREAYLDTFEVQRDWIVQCLAERGMDVEPTATRLELLYAVTEADLRFPTAGTCYQGQVFDGYLPPGVDPVDLYPPAFLDDVESTETLE